MVCAPIPEAPRIEGLMAFQVGEGMAYDKGQVDARDAKIARWLIELRGAWFECSNQLAWIREYYEAQE